MDNPWIIHGYPWIIHGSSMDHPWIIHGYPWIFHGYPWMIHGYPWISMDFPWISMDDPWISMDYPWISMDNPWISMDIHGNHVTPEASGKCHITWVSSCFRFSGRRVAYSVFYMACSGSLLCSLLGALFWYFRLISFSFVCVRLFSFVFV